DRYTEYAVPADSLRPHCSAAPPPADVPEYFRCAAAAPVSVPPQAAAEPASPRLPGACQKQPTNAAIVRSVVRPPPDAPPPPVPGTPDARLSASPAHHSAAPSTCRPRPHISSAPERVPPPCGRHHPRQPSVAAGRQRPTDR